MTGRLGRKRKRGRIGEEREMKAEPVTGRKGDWGKRGRPGEKEGDEATNYGWEGSKKS